MEQPWRCFIIHLYKIQTTDFYKYFYKYTCIKKHFILFSTKGAKIVLKQYLKKRYKHNIPLYKQKSVKIQNNIEIKTYKNVTKLLDMQSYKRKKAKT